MCVIRPAVPSRTPDFIMRRSPDGRMQSRGAVTACRMTTPPLAASRTPIAPCLAGSRTHPTGQLRQGGLHRSPPPPPPLRAEAIARHLPPLQRRVVQASLVQIPTRLPRLPGPPRLVRLPVEQGHGWRAEPLPAGTPASQSGRLIGPAHATDLRRRRSHHGLAKRHLVSHGGHNCMVADDDRCMVAEGCYLVLCCIRLWCTLVGVASHGS